MHFMVQNTMNFFHVMLKSQGRFSLKWAFWTYFQLEMEILSVFLDWQKIFFQCCTGKSLSEAFILTLLTHNMKTDCSLIYQFNTWKLKAQNMGRTCCAHKFLFCFDIQNNLCTQHVLPMFWACSFHALNW